MSSFSIKSKQRRVRQLFLKKTGLGTPTLSGLSSDEATITDNGVGDYTINLNKSYAESDGVAIATSLTADAVIDTVTMLAGTVQVTCVDATDGTTAKECDFFIQITGSDITDRYAEEG